MNETLSPAISTLARMRMWRIESWIQHPVEAQREVLQDLVTSAQYTEFGRKYNFSATLYRQGIQATFPFMNTTT